MVILKHESNRGKFIQIDVHSDEVMLDFPVLSPNDNTEEDADFIREKVSDRATDLIEGPAGGEGIQVTLPREDKFTNFMENIITEIWPDCRSIRTETL
jgi:hypothetical protein